jgi:uncharacterized protein (TIGR02145 family)
MRQWWGYILVFSWLFLSLSCVRFEPRGFLFITTDSVYMDAGEKGMYEFEGAIVNIGEEDILQHGFCWAETQRPNTWDSYTDMGQTDEKGIFTSTIEGVKAHTTFYVRAYVTTSEGILYGNEKSFISSTLAIPTVQSYGATHVNSKSAVCGGEVLLEGDFPVSRRGVCWSIEELPTLSDQVAEAGEGPGIFSVEIEDLELKTLYFVRAFATNSDGTAYGDVISFKTWAEGEFADYDGNVYPSVEIGEQTWMKENLRVTHYADGRPIQEEVWNWGELPAGYRAYCWQNNDSASWADPYGALYTWGGAMDGAGSNDSNPGEVQGVCPDGWHLPSDQEWQEMELFLGMDPAEVDTLGLRERGDGFGGRLKEIGYKYWRNPNSEATNFTGFSAVGSGFRQIDGIFRNLGRTATFWTSTEFNTANIWTRGLNYNNSWIRRGYDYKGSGFSVRCVKNESDTKSSQK